MRGDRPSARLSRPLVGVVAAAIAFGVAAASLPYVKAGVRPNIPDLVVGWTLIGSGIALSERRPSKSGWLIAAAGVAWFAVDLSPLLSGEVRDVLESAALAYLALLAHGVLALPSGNLEGSLARAATAIVYGVALAAGAGYYRVGLVVAGAAIIIATVGRWVAAGDRRTRAAVATLVAGLVMGSGVFVTAVLRLTALPLPESVLARSFLVTIVVTSVLAFVAGSANLDALSGIDLGGGGLGALDSVVGRALGRTAVSVRFPAPGGGWIGPSGDPAHVDPERSLMIREDHEVLAALSATASPADVTTALRELLRLAAAHARLQVAVRSRLDDLVESRRRLLDAADAERRQLEAQLRNGALARLETVEALVTGAASLRALRERVAITRNELDGIARGIDPLASGCLGEALADLTRWSQLDVTLNVTDVEPPTPIARTIWYTCSEALANVAKHAPGSSVAITVDTTADEIVATVVDDGPGGTDVSGSGLNGLADRASTLGGSFVVGSDSGGTNLVLTLPLGYRG